MARYVTEVEKELMWHLYQKYGVIKIVAEKMGRDRGTVSRHVREYEAMLRGISLGENSKDK